jgi:hypothetical protein
MLCVNDNGAQEMWGHKMILLMAAIFPWQGGYE